MAVFRSDEDPSDARALQLYDWNAAVSAALFEMIGRVEVIVRNGIHEQLTSWNAAQSVGGWWFDNGHGYLRAEEFKAVEASKRRLILRYRRIVPDAMTANLGFGFWRRLLSDRYRTTLWPFAMRKAFPHLASADAPRLFAAMGQLHILRNRVAHHEPIHRRDLAADYAACGFVLGAVSPEVEAWATADARIPELLALRP
jgi:hypothetical protein